MISLSRVPSLKIILPKYLNETYIYLLGAIDGDARLFRKGSWYRLKEDHCLDEADR